MALGAMWVSSFRDDEMDGKFEVKSVLTLFSFLSIEWAFMLLLRLILTLETFAMT
jgi:hypothetical protein